MPGTANPKEMGLTTGPTTPFFFPFLDEEKRKIAEIVMDYVVIFTICVMGVVTNALVILVYAK